MKVSVGDKRIRATLTAISSGRIRLTVDYPAEDPYIETIPRAFGEILRRAPSENDDATPDKERKPK